jgi:hypothetical protein
VFRGFFQKDRFFLKNIDSFKESDRTYSFDIPPLPPVSLRVIVERSIPIKVG